MRLRSSIVLCVLAFFSFFCLGAAPLAASANGSAGEMPAVYDGQPLVINFKEQPANAEESLLEHNKPTNAITPPEDLLPGDRPFVPVTDAIREMDSILC